MLATNHQPIPHANGHGHGHGYGYVSATEHAVNTNQNSSATSATTPNPDCGANYEFLSVIGSGSFGRICKVRRLRDNQIMARKEIDYRRMKEKERRQLVQEVNILRELAHPNIVKYYSRYVDRESCVINILMEYCEAGDLSTVIKQHKQRGRWIDEEVVWTFAAQLVAALHECHHAYAERKREEGHASGGNAAAEGGAVLHRDIKPDNARSDSIAHYACGLCFSFLSLRDVSQVFLDADHNAKLGDFGLSTQCTQHDFARTFVGTPFYMSPELVREQAYNAKSDIWSLGCLLYELCALDPPFRGQTHRQLNENILNVRYPELSHTHYSAQLRGLIARMLQLRPEDRPSARDLFHDPLLQAALEAKRAKDEASRRNRDMAKVLEAVSVREADVGRRETEVAIKEEAVRAREAAVAQREEQLVAEGRRIEMEMENVRAERARLEGVQQQLVQHEAHLTQVQAQLEAEVQQVRGREEQVQRAMQEVHVQQSKIQAAQAQVQASTQQIALETTVNGFSTPSSFMSFQQQRQQQQVPSTAPRPASTSWAQPSLHRAPSTTHRSASTSSSSFSRRSNASAPASVAASYPNQFTPQPQPHTLQSRAPSSASVQRYSFSSPTFTSALQQQTIWTQFRTPVPEAPVLTVDESPTTKVLGPFDNLQLESPAQQQRGSTLKWRPDDNRDAFAQAERAQAQEEARHSLQQSAESGRAQLVRKQTAPPPAGADSNLIHGLADMVLETPPHPLAPSARSVAAPSPRQWTEHRQSVPDSPMPVDSTMADVTGIAGSGRTPMTTITRKTTGPATWTLTNLPDTPTADTPTPAVRAGACVSKMARQPVFTAATASSHVKNAARVGGEFKVPGMPASAMRRGAGNAGGAAEEMSTPVAQIRPRIWSRRSGAGATADAAGTRSASGNRSQTT